MNEQLTGSQVRSDFSCLENRPENFIAGKISQLYYKWETLTKDRFILDFVKYGYELEFDSEPCEQCNSMPINFNEIEQKITSKLLDKFEDKGVIVEKEHELGEIFSHIFIRPKSKSEHIN